MTRKSYNLTKILFIIFLFFAYVQIGNSQCNPGDTDTDNDGICDALDECTNFDDYLDIDEDSIPYCLDNCVDVDEDNICDDADTSITVDKLKIYFSHQRGFYENAFELQLLANDPNATIIYSTNGDDPSTNGQLFTTPISIDKTTVVRAIVIDANNTNFSVSHSYLFLDEVISSGILNTSYTNDPVHGSKMNDYLTDIPTISISGINTNLPTTEIKISMEMIFPNGDEGFHINCGGKRTGNHSLGLPKGTFRLYFRGEYGADKLRFPVFDGYEEHLKSTETFDQLILRGGNADTHWWQGIRGQNTRNRFAAEIHKKMGNLDVHGRFVHLYLNGTYWGQYNLMERPNAAFMSEYFGGKKDDYEAYKGSTHDCSAFDGDGSAYTIMTNNSGNYNNLKKYLEVEDFARYQLLNYYVAKHDLYTCHNWTSTAAKDFTYSKYRFFTWDEDGIFRNIDDNVVSISAPGNLGASVFQHDEFDRLFADVTQCQCFDEGALTPGSVIETYEKVTKQVEQSIIAECARWGMDYNTWLEEKNRLLTDYLVQRTDVLITQLRAANKFPELSAVNISPGNNDLQGPENITLSNPNNSGSIYYTIDGSDPIAADNVSVNPNAILYQESFQLPKGVYKIIARVHDPSQSATINKWSAACPKTYYIGQNYENVIINEIHYNPNDSIYYNNSLAVNDTVDGKNFEFVELKNIGSDPVNLLNCRFSKGIDLKIEEHLILEPDSFVVFAEDVFWFEQKYGFNPDAVFKGKLDNGGEKINLKTPFGNFIDTLHYDDGGVWDTTPDEGEYSLAYFVNATDNSNPANWAAQKVFVTPRAENEFCVPISNNATVVDISCNGADDGFIISQLTGGTAPFSYSWANGATTSNITSLTAGNYTVTITDRYNCPYTESFTVNEPAQLVGSITSTNQTYYQTNDGSASLANVTGGVLPYTYNWSNGATTASINNLPPGTYTVDVIDVNGCSFSQSIVINAISCNVIVAGVTIENETCIGANDGFLIINNISNGTPPYSILWSTGITGTVANNLTSNNYQLTITDLHGCPYQNNYTIEAENIVQASFNINDVSSSNLTDGSIEVMHIGGDAPFSYEWSNRSTNQNLYNISEGNYSVTITDANGCTEFFDQLTIDNNCTASLIQQNNPAIRSQIYQVAQFIHSNATVNANQQVSFKAGDYVQLTNDFEVIKGAEFEAIIDGCN